MTKQKNKDKYTTTIEPKIYGLEVDGDLVYVGKTHVADTNGKLRRTKIQTLHTNPKLHKAIKGNKDKTNIIDLKNTTVQEWYKDRNSEAHFKFINGEVKLLNSPWILEGKRCYWDGKVKDKHTIERLSESKHIKVVQYDANGDRVKIWGSAKEIGLNVVKDYVVIDGSSKSRIYHILKAKKVKNKFFMGSYWFKESDLILNFGTSPIKLNIPKLIESQINRAKSVRKHTPAGSTLIYTVKRLSKDKKLLQTYKSSVEAGNVFNCSHDTIRKACKNGREYLGYYWKYGKKKRLKVNKKGQFTK